MLPKITR